MPFTNRPYCTYSGSVKPSFLAISWVCSAFAVLPTYREARSSEVAPASRGTRKKIAKVTTLTTNSSSTDASSRRTMYLNMCPAAVAGEWILAGHRSPSPAFEGAQGLLHAEREVVVHLEAVADEHVLQPRRPVQQTARPDARQDNRFLHDAVVDLAPDLLARADVGGLQRLVDERVDLGDLHGQVRVAARRPGDPAVDDLLQEAEAVRPVRAPAVGHDAQAVVLGVVRLGGVELEVVTLRERLERELDAGLGEGLLQRLGQRLLLRPLGTVRHVRREPVRLAALLEVGLGGVRVAALLGPGG